MARTLNVVSIIERDRKNPKGLYQCSRQCGVADTQLLCIPWGDVDVRWVELMVSAPEGSPINCHADGQKRA